jgi:hypothetical protein
MAVAQIERIGIETKKRDQRRPGKADDDRRP